MERAASLRLAAGSAAAREALAELGELGPRLAGTLGGSIAVAAFGAASGIVLARVLGPVGRGQLTLLLLWPQLLSTLANLGVDLAATHFSADPARRANVPRTVLRLSLAQSALAASIYLLLWPLVLGGAHLGLLPLLMLPLIPIDLVAVYATCCLNGRHDHQVFNAVRSAMAPLYAAGVGLLAAAGALTVGSAAVVFVASNGVLAALALVFLARRHGLGRRDRLLGGEIRRFGLRGHLGRLSPQNLGLDLLLVALVLSTRELGVFTVAVAFLAASRIASSSVALVVYPRASAAHLTGQALRLRATIVLTVAATAGAAGLLWLFATPLATTLFGERFREAASIVPILALGEIARSAYLLLIEAVRGTGRPGLTTLVELGDWTLFLAAVWAGAATAGLEGVAVALALAAAASLALLLVVARRRGVLVALFGARAEVAAG